MAFITGFIDNNGQHIRFCSEEGSYYFCPMAEEVTSGYSPIRLNDENGFIYGNTSNGRKIAIYIGMQPLICDETTGFRTGAYIISSGMTKDTDEIKSFDAISFHGGTLCKIFTAKGIEVLPPDDKSGYIAKSTSDLQEYEITLDEFRVKISVSSLVKRNISPVVKIDNSEVVLTLEFSKPQPLSDLIIHYQVIRRILSFMTYRQNVVFDSIELLNYNKKFDMLLHSADVFIRSDAKNTSKESFRCLSVEKLGNSFSNLVKITYETYYARNKNLDREQMKKMLPSIGFIPENDSDASLMTNAKLREICSAIEHEIDNNPDINVEKNEIIGALVSDLKKKIREFKRNNPGLSEDEYSALSSNMAHWSLPLRERIYALCQKYESNIKSIASSRYSVYDYTLNKDAVKDFTDYRNGITHSAGSTISDSIVQTAFLLSGVVYCSILKRISVEDEKINEFCLNGIIS